jgi:SSS family solute:Na+ symporter
MYLLDWLIVAAPVVIVVGVTIYAHQYLKSVADFLSGGRLAGRYLLSTASSEMGAGAIAYVAMFEWFSHGGFPVSWWGALTAPVALIVSISGFVVYRFRQTRALTLAQFFEMRYTRKFRLATGLLGFISGLLNFGVIPVIGGKFMVSFLDLPPTFQLGPLVIPTYLALMGGFLTTTTIITLTGGQITVMIADCIQGMLSQIFYVVIGFFLVITFSWVKTRDMLLSFPPGHSIVNPFDSFDTKDFNIWYVAMILITSVYGTMAWQNRQGFNSAAATPHEGRMAGVLGRWRGFALGTSMLLLALASMTYLHQPDNAAVVQQHLDKISDSQTAEQMRLPVGLAQILPIGIKGLLVSVVLMGILGGDGQHLHSWGSIFFQDIVLPLRGRPFEPATHIWLLRLSIIGVALFAFFFGAFFTQTEYLPMWFNVTTAIFVGGAGVAIIGGLYWSRGTTAGAWVGLFLGSSLSVLGILLRQPECVTIFRELAGKTGFMTSSGIDSFAKHLGPDFPLNGTQIGFGACLAAVAGYTVVSLLTCREPHDMDRLLHRGKYAVEPEAGHEPLAARPVKARFHLYNIIGIDEHFTGRDRWVAIGIFFWSLMWAAVTAIGSLWNLLHPWSSETWANFWIVTNIYLNFTIAIATTIWFTVGCWRDLMVLFQRLRTERINPNDDGTVETNSH